MNRLIHVHTFLKSEPDEQFEMGSSTEKNDLVQFVRLYEMELVTEYNGMVTLFIYILYRQSRCIKINKPLSFIGSFQTSSKILNSEVLNHFILFINKTEEGYEEIYNAFKTTAGKLRGKVSAQLAYLAINHIKWWYRNTVDNYSGVVFL